MSTTEPEMASIATPLAPEHTIESDTTPTDPGPQQADDRRHSAREPITEGNPRPATPLEQPDREAPEPEADTKRTPLEIGWEL